MMQILRRLMGLLTNSQELQQEDIKTMDPIMVVLISEGIKTLLPAIISIMHQSGMTEAQVHEAWQSSYDKFKLADPNQLPTA